VLCADCESLRLDINVPDVTTIPSGRSAPDSRAAALATDMAPRLVPISQTGGACGRR